MSQERLLAKIKEYAKENNIDLNAMSPNERWLNWWKVEAAVRKLFPELVEDGPTTQTVNADETRKASEYHGQAIVLAKMREISKQQNLDMGKREDWEKAERLALKEIETSEKGPVKVRISFSKQQAIRFSYDDLIAEWLSARQLNDTPQNRAMAKKFYTDLATKRGMTTLDPGLLRMSDATFENYVSLLRY